MGEIRVLSDDIRNLIAAGEVVERPASVVKELVENSIDAGAGDIQIDVEEGGLRNISVSDDGIGMDADDLRLCTARYATSKLKDADALYGIETMGFRGEALPSIAQVSKMRIESMPRAGGVLSGHFLEIAGGEAKGFGEKGAPPGTRVIISDLFYNVPARKKFMRLARTELGHIKDIVERLALANPAVRFRLVSEGKEVVSAFSLADQRQRASEIFGADLIKNTYQCDHDAGEVRVYGLIGDPSIAHEGATGLYWFVNRRPIKDRLLNHAVNEAYRSLLPRGSQPFSLLYITLPAKMVDVNVHPTKSEVRFLKGRAVHDLVAGAVRKSLGMRAPVRPLPTPEFRPPDYAPQITSSEIRDTRYEQRDTRLRPIGQLRNTYILCEGDGGQMVVIDQHAAHERIGYERLKRGYEKSVTPSQRLLVPDVVRVPSNAEGYLEEALPDLNKIGWEIEYFGGGDFCIKAVPAILGNINLKSSVVAIAEDIASCGKWSSHEERLDFLMKTSACHAQVRAGEVLGDSEIRHLLRDMDEFDWSDRCPHGRPAVYEIGLEEIKKWFKR